MIRQVSETDGHNHVDISIREKPTVDIKRERLLAVYRFAGEILVQRLTMPVEAHLDVGTSDGFALGTLADFATRITTFDIDAEKLWAAQQRPEVVKLIAEGRLTLLQIDARSIQLPPEQFDSATIVEVFGAGFKGESSKDADRRDVMRVFEGVQKALKPGGVLVFTIKSGAGNDLFNVTGWPGLESGIALDRRGLDLSLRRLYQKIEWYGQIPVHDSKEGSVLPFHLTRESLRSNPAVFTPRKMSEGEVPLFWVGICQK